MELTLHWRGSSLLPLITGDGGWQPHEYVFYELCHRSIQDGYRGYVDTDELVIAVIDET